MWIHSSTTGVPPVIAPRTTGVSPVIQVHDEDSNHRRDAGGTLDAGSAVAFDARMVEVHHGASLPHWRQEGAVYFVTWRLADSLPRELAAEVERERDALRRALAAATEVEEQRVLESRLRHLVTERMDELLNQGLGECWMNRPEVASLVVDALCHFDGERYRLWAFAVMPNHVHVVVEPLGEHPLDDILHSWKSFTSHAINKLVGRKGTLWQKECFDHIVRSQKSLDHFVAYTLANPSAAGLTDWPWTSTTGVPPVVR